jgi:hypothetical protein
MPNKETKNIQKLVANLVKNISGRNRDIISRRFGLSNGKKETLESIGRSYGITRERVRQIEEFILAQLSKSVSSVDGVEKHANLAREIISKNGGVMNERDLFNSFSGNEKDSVVNSSLVFLLTIHKDFIRSNDNDSFNAFWALGQKYADSFSDSVLALVSALKKNKNVISRDSIVEFAKQNAVRSFDGSQPSEKVVSTLLSVCKNLDENIFGEIGLSVWPEIKPKGVRDKAYLIMKKEKEPRHFGEIAKLINSANFLHKKKVNVQTVHNELIKDSRFVLVGRGMYALTEWGYRSGTVKDVLVDILKGSSKPLTRAELVAKVMDVRIVKENTILLNLQDSSQFSKNTNGAYVLKRA